MIKTLLLFAYNFLRIACMKMFHGTHADIHWLQRISPLCSLKIFEKGTLKIGRNTEFAAYCDHEVLGKGKLIIGDGVYMNRFCMISAHDEVTIGDHCLFGPGVRIFDNNHKFAQKNGVSTDLSTAPIHIGKNCWIASNVIILKGSTLGDNSVIGAGCIIHGNVPAGSVVKCKQDLIIS